MGMNIGRIIAAHRYALAMFFFTILSCASYAQIMQHIQDGIEGVAKGLDYVGDRAVKLIGPGLELPKKESAAEFRRTFEEKYPVGKSPMVSLSNEFGSIRVNTWSESIISVSAEIVATGESNEAAEQLAGIVDIRISHGEDFFECRTVYPEFNSSGQTSVTANYTINIPESAGLAVDNFFGDAYLNNIGGMIAADIQYGGLEINSAASSVQARVQGDFPVRISGLQQGGIFKFQGVTAEFSNINGNIDINHFRGKVNLTQIGSNANITLTCDNTPAFIALLPEMDPDISAVVAYGKLESALNMSRTVRGNQVIAQHPNAEALQKISINATFSDVTLAVEDDNSEVKNNPADDNKTFTDVKQETIPVADAAAVRINAIQGNIDIEGVDTDELFVEATRVAWTPSAASALDALDALGLSVITENGTITIQTQTTQDMAIFDCYSYRVDLKIRYPREIPLEINAQEGITSVQGVGNALVANQTKGEILLKDINGSITAVNTSGDIRIQDCGGTADISTQYGTLAVEKILGSIRTNVIEGSTYIDAPQSDVFVRHKSGDVRILCLDPIQGNFDVRVEDGNLKAFIAPDSDASLNLKITNGKAQSSLSLSGTINRDFQEFFGRLNAETHTVRLECINGDIFLN